MGFLIGPACISLLKNWGGRWAPREIARMAASWRWFTSVVLSQELYADPFTDVSAMCGGTLFERLIRSAGSRDGAERKI